MFGCRGSIGGFVFAAVAMWAMPASAQIITVDPAQHEQTIAGWEAVQYALNESPAFPRFINEVLDRAVNDMGLNRVRLEVKSGAESNHDYWSDFENGVIDNATWRCYRYATVNDNGSPTSIATSGFQFSSLDWAVDHVVNPLRQRVAANGEALYVNLNYVAFTNQIRASNCPVGLTYGHDDPAEYAEFMLAVFQHMQSKYGWVPDAIEVILEPDNVVEWRSGTVIGRAIAATAARLEAAGFTPDFIAPSTTNMSNAAPYFDQMIAVPGVSSRITELAYHRYAGVSLSALQGIASRASANGIATSMLEWWDNGNGYDVLHQDLKVGNNSAWQWGAIAGPGPTSFISVNDSNPSAPVVSISSRSSFVRQYFRYVRAGAVRVGATSTTGTLDPLAFVNTNGRNVVVVKASAASSFQVQGLAAGTYGITYTTNSASFVSASDVTIASGAALSASIPAAGVITIYAKTNAPSCTPVTESCNGRDDDCDGHTDEAWPMLGADCNVGVGVCAAAGHNVCTDAHDGIQCDATPGEGSNEVCGNDVDENCDGALDDGCACTPTGETRPCYGGPEGTEGVGECHAGMQVCMAGMWDSCIGSSVPSVEACDDGIDNDCNGLTDAEDTESCRVEPDASVDADGGVQNDDASEGGVEAGDPSSRKMRGHCSVVAPGAGSDGSMPVEWCALLVVGAYFALRRMRIAKWLMCAIALVLGACGDGAEGGTEHDGGIKNERDAAQVEQDGDIVDDDSAVGADAGRDAQSMNNDASNGHDAGTVDAGDEDAGPTGRPGAMDFRTYYGASEFDHARDAAFDSSGNLYVTGGTTSGGNVNSFTAKFSVDGHLLWQRVIGGGGYERTYAVEVQGNFIYVAGRAGPGLSTTPGVLQPSFGGDMDANPAYGQQDALVAKLDAANGNIVWVTYFGGPGRDFIRDIAVDANGDAYVAVSQVTRDHPHITAGAFDTTRNGWDTVVAKIASDGRSVLYASYLGGSGDDGPEPSIRVNAAGEAHMLIGTHASDVHGSATFHRYGSGGQNDLFVAKVAANGHSLIWGAYVGGSQNEGSETHNLTLDPAGNVYVGAITRSTDLPTTANAFQRAHGGNGGSGTGQNTNYPGDGFVMKISADGAHLIACTYLGGSVGDAVEGIAIDSSGNIHVSGGTFSTNLPTTANAFQRTQGGDLDGFVGVLSSDLSQVIYLSYWGGSAWDVTRAIAVDNVGPRVALAGETKSPNLPLVGYSYRNTYGGGTYDAIATAFSL